MAVPKIKSTYVMDVDTVEALERIARRWRVSKSEALRRAIRDAANAPPPASNEALAALDALQGSLALTPARARAWARAAWAERKTTSARSESRVR